MRLFFRDVAVIGEENVPKNGPVILYGNHNNQFVDGTVRICVMLVDDGQCSQGYKFYSSRSFVQKDVRGTVDQGYWSDSGLKTAGHCI
jgi:hypothetical protein